MHTGLQRLEELLDRALADEHIVIESPLHATQIPGIGQGWWWEPPLPIETNASCSVVHALLWGYVQPAGEKPDAEGWRLAPRTGAGLDRAAIRFSVYTWVKEQEKQVIAPAPSTTWTWYIGETLHQMQARTIVEYREHYDPAIRPRVSDGPSFDAKHTMGEQHTLNAVTELSGFFLAACAWMEQKIVAVNDGPIGQCVECGIAVRFRPHVPAPRELVCLTCFAGRRGGR